MADEQIVNSSTAAAPKDYLVPDAAEFILKSVHATFDGSGAAGDWLPCLTLISDSGHEIAGGVDQGVKITAGQSAKVSWFPGVKKAAAGTTGTAVLPQAGAMGFGFFGYTGTSVPGNSTLTIPFMTFSTTDTGTFGTNDGNGAPYTPTNVTGNPGMTLQRFGAYAFVSFTQWSVGSVNVGHLFNVQNGNHFYTDYSYFTPTELLASTALPGGNHAISYNIDYVYVDTNGHPGSTTLVAQNADGVAHSLIEAGMSAFYLGGPGVDLATIYT